MKKIWQEFKQSDFSNKLKMLLPIFSLIIALSITIWLSFQYFLLADFPIGQDVIYHLNRVLVVEKEGLASAFHFSIYPFSVIALIFWHKFLGLFGMSLVRIFIFAECFYLLAIAILSGILAKKVFNNFWVGIITMILVASSRWLNDYLRIGLIAETLGLVFFVASLIMLVEKKWIWLAIFMILLFLSHPLPFFVFLVIFLAFNIFWFFTRKGKKIHIVVFIIILLAIALGLIYLFWPGYIHTVLYYFHAYVTRKDERTFFHYMIDYDKRRLILYAVGFLGVIWSLVNFKRSKKFWLFFIFFVLALLICFKQYLGIHYLSFRFYAYFEIGIAVFAAFAIVNLGKVSSKWLVWLIIPALIFVCVYPNYWSNKDITNWQLHDDAAGNILPSAERKNLSAIEEKIDKRFIVYSPSDWVLWMGLDGFDVKTDWSFGNQFRLRLFGLPLGKTDEEWLEFFQNKKIKYLYFPSTSPVYQIEQSNFLQLIFNQDNIRLYEIQF